MLLGELAHIAFDLNPNTAFDLPSFDLGHGRAYARFLAIAQKQHRFHIALPKVFAIASCLSLAMHAVT